ncbi:MAG: ATP-binding cassette domain-containing protein [Candidatus Velamenicoccus archaeovorus]
MADVILAEDLTKSYGKQRGVTGLSFAVRPGEVFGYLGPNGAGKTTTIRTFMDFIRPTAGQITVFGLEPRSRSIEIHRRTGYLPGEISLYGRMTGAEYLSHLAALRGGVDRSYVLELADRLDSDLGVRIRSLSHGNRQKVALIQAFMHRPELLVLDEPTTGLDPLVQQVFHRLIEEVRQEGRTVFLSSHVLPEVERLCDRVAIIRAGRLMAVEDVGHLKARAVRTLDVHFAGPVPAEAFAGLPNVTGVEAQGDVLRITVTGPVDAVVKAMGRFEVVDLESHEPSLEDIFLTFYGRDETDGA